MNEQPIVVLGAGQIGSLVTQKLLAAGHRVRQVRRSGAPRSDGLLEVVSGDLSDLAFAERIGRDARAVIHCATPPYHQWMSLLEPLNAGALHAAQNAPLVVLDNLYGYGRPTGPLTETSPVNPCSRKGELRARVAQRLLDAKAHVTIARASDFYGPNITLAATFGERFGQRIVKGKAGECFGDPTLLHSYSFAGDVADGLITLALAPQKQSGEIWHLPVAKAESTAAVVSRFGRALGFPDVKTVTVPAPVLHVMGLFVPAVKELIEMRYQWQVPFVLDDSKFRAAFGTGATSLDDGVMATVRALRPARPLTPALSPLRKERESQG
ncbi:MAG: NAD-dependent epimerase/dehydratase family protein [Archangium sp.]